MSKQVQTYVCPPPDDDAPHVSPQIANKSIRLYHKIVAFIVQFKHPPSLREMGVMMNSNSTSLMRDYIQVLKAWGWIGMDGGQCRTIQLTRPTERGLSIDELRAFFKPADKTIVRLGKQQRQQESRSQTLIAQPPTRRQIIRSQIQPYAAEKVEG